MLRTCFALLLILIPTTTSAGTLFRAPAPDLTPLPTEGLVLHYPFNSSTQDMSGNGNHGAVFGAALVEDKFGNQQSAYYLDGQKNHLTAPLNISPSVMPQVTMVVWAKAEEDEWVGRLLTNANRYGPGRALGMRPSLDRGGFWATSNNGVGSWVWHKVDVEEWTFLAVSFDQDAKWMRLHVNDSKYERDCVAAGGNTELAIGRHPRFGQYFHGVIDQVRVYDRILTEQEIAALYQEFLYGEQPEDDEMSLRDGGRRGLMVTFIAGFSLFAGALLAANIIIRKNSPFA